ncbi:MAG: exo-alpha-sialidase [Thermoplasmatales archaeon]|nr:exo-alpha-sialidase [Thermoplasmatales archaeon]
MVKTYQKIIRICIVTFLTAMLLCPSFGIPSISTKIIGNAEADYVDVSHDANESDIVEDPLVPGWSKDVRLTNTSERSHNPSIALDSKGGIHVAWTDDLGDGYGIYYSKSTDDGNTWSILRRIDKGDASSIAVDNNGTVYVTYFKREGSGDSDIWYSKSGDNGYTWSKYKIVDTPCISSVPKIVIKGNMTYLVWSDKRDNGEFEVYYKSSSDEGMHWSDDKRVTNTPNESSMPSFIVDSHNVHVIYQEAVGNEYELCYTNSKDNGDSWLQPQVLAESSPDFREPVITADSLGVLHVVWTDNRARATGWVDVCYKKSADRGESWSESIDISGHLGSNTSMPLGRSFMSTIATDKFDNIFIVWTCSNFTYENGSLVRTSNDIYYRYYNIAESKWSNITRITYAFDGGRLYPKLITDEQNLLHMVWFDNRNGNQEIYYKRSLCPVSEKPIAVTLSLNQTTCKPSRYITVSGNAVYNNTTVLSANVFIKILETGDEWNTTTDSNGDYSKTIIAPDTAGNYTIRVTITSGNHTGWKLMRLTVEEESTNGGTTNGEQAGGGEGKIWFNLNYVLGVVATIVVCIIIGVVLVKRRGKQTAKVKEKEKPMQMLRCPKCRKTFRVEVKPKPFLVKCPYCGKEGVMK